MNTKQRGFIDFTPVFVLAWIGIAAIVIVLLTGGFFLDRWLVSLFS